MNLGRDRELTAQLSANLQSWQSVALSRHFVAVLFLTLFAMLRWFPWVAWLEPLNDEMVYFGAFRFAAEGLSPFSQRGYLYPPILALAGGWGLQQFGEVAVIAVVRVANVLGLAITVWCAMAWLPWRWTQRLIVGAVFLSISPQVRFSMLFGNLSLAVAGLIILGLLTWHRRPLLAGFLLGVSVAIKQVAPVAIGLLFLLRPVGGGRRHQIAGVASAAIVAGLALSFPFFGDIPALGIEDRLARTVSIHRFAHLMRIPYSTIWLSALVALTAAVMVRKRRMSQTHFMLFAIAAALMATPLVWSHTLIVALPLEIIALQIACSRYRQGRQKWRADPSQPARFRIEMILVVLAVLGIQFSEGSSGIYDRSFLLQFFGTMPQAFGPMALVGYVFMTTDPTLRGNS
jgi:hypothetical protein